jgi:cytochrome c biogenesis protein CcmG/thiol:disulfide interchange protein DsbE
MKVLRLLPFLLLIVLITFFWLGLASDPQKLPSSKLGQTIPNFDLPMLVGKQTQHFTPELLSGHMTVLVVWASWCEACREEQEFLLQLAQQKNFKLLGLNYKDDPRVARVWLADWGNPFQAIGIDRYGKLGLDLGVYGTPETYLIDPSGKILHRYAGLLTPEVWRKEFMGWLS